MVTAILVHLAQEGGLMEEAEAPQGSEIIKIIGYEESSLLWIG